MMVMLSLILTVECTVLLCKLSDRGTVISYLNTGNLPLHGESISMGVLDGRAATIHGDN
jgi:hypothetical protein